MSVVGPRPALPNEVATYNDYQRQRLLVKPGMTCYWQTRRNRDSITFDEWVDLDLWNPPFRSPAFALVLNAVGICASRRSILRPRLAAGLYRAGVDVEPYESGSIVHRTPLP